MPGRLSVYDDTAFKRDIALRFATLKDDVGVLKKCYNIAPTIDIPIYTNNKIYTYAHFGLIPSWAKDRGSLQVNARSETVFEKSSFKEAYKSRRCLIPINGYYEWLKDSHSKKIQAYFVQASSKEYLVCAGLHESWYDNVLKQTVLTCALLTTEPNEKIAGIHDRMPVILEEDDWGLWLNTKSTYAQLNKLYMPQDSEKITYYTVSDVVNSVKNDSIECIKEVSKSEPRQGSLF